MPHARRQKPDRERRLSPYSRLSYARQSAMPGQQWGLWRPLPVHNVRISEPLGSAVMRRNAYPTGGMANRQKRITADPSGFWRDCGAERWRMNGCVRTYASGIYPNRRLTIPKSGVVGKVGGGRYYRWYYRWYNRWYNRWYHR